MGGYIWYPEDENIEAYKNVLFYFNGMEGNGSSRFNILRKLQQDYTDFTILQMDYPGFGLSYNVPLTLKSLKEECSFVMREILTSNPVEKYSCWGEGLGNWVMLSCLDSYLDYDPDKIIHYNISTSIQENMNDNFSIVSYFFIFSYLNTKNIPYYYKKRFKKKSPQVYFLYNDDKLKKERSFQCYYDLDSISFSSKNVIYVEGKGNSSVLMKENFEKIKNIMI